MIKFDLNRFDNYTSDVLPHIEVITEINTRIYTQSSVVTLKDTRINTQRTVISLIDTMIKTDNQTRKELIESIEIITKNRVTKQLIEISLDASIEYINRYTHKNYNYNTLPTPLIFTLGNIIEVNTSNILLESKKLSGDYSVTYRDITVVDRRIKETLDLYRQRLFSLGV